MKCSGSKVGMPENPGVGLVDDLPLRGHHLLGL